MIKKIIKKILMKIGILNKIKSLRYKEITKLLNLKNGYVYELYQLDYLDGRLVSKGNDPQIFIEFKKGIKSIKFNYSIDHNADKIEVFYSNISNIFNAENHSIIGVCDSVNRNDVLELGDSYKYVRLDLVTSPGEINIKCFSIENNENDEKMFDDILSKIDSDDNDKYIIVTHSMNETGAPLLAFNISKKLKSLNHDVVVIALSSGYLEKEYLKLNIPVFDLHQGDQLNKILNPKYLNKLLTGLKAKGFKNVITNTIISGITVPYFKNLDFNVISLIHEMKNSIKAYNMEDGGRYINFYSDLIIFPDKIVEKQFMSLFDDCSSKSLIMPQGIYKEVCDIVPNKEKVCSKYNIPKNAHIIIGSGTADFRKGIDLFLQAAQQLINLEDKDLYHFIWCGKFIDPEVKKWLEYQFELQNLNDRIHIIDFIKDSKEYQNLVSCSDAFWLTSREDPFPSVMIESLEYDTPVVAFRGTGGADTLLANNRGVLVENFDIEKFVNSTISLINNKDIAKNMIIESKKYIKEKLNFDNYVDSLIKTFNYKNKKEYADISVVIPNYNYANYIEMRIKSIFEQTILPKEIIFLDDNSTDNSVSVAKKVLDKLCSNTNVKYRIIKNNSNQGCFKQWIKGIKESKYEYIWIAEADDYIRPNFIEEVFPAFKNKDVVLSYCKSCVIDSDSIVVDYDYNSYCDDLCPNLWNSSFVYNGKDYVEKFMVNRNIIPNASSVIFRKSATVGLEDELSKYSSIGDWFAYIYIMLNGKVKYNSHVLNGHRRHRNSIIAKTEKSDLFIREILNIKKYILNNIEISDDNLIRSIMSLFNNQKDIKYLKSDKYKNEIIELSNIAKKKFSKKNIIIILPDFEVGGGQSVGIRLANNFIKKYNVFLINARERQETDFMKKMISDNVHTLRYYDDLEIINFYNNLFGFDTCISLIWWSDKLAYMAFKDSNTKTIISMHGCYENLLDNPNIDTYFENNVESMFDNAKYIVYTAEKNKRIFNELKNDYSNKIRKIDNGFVLGDYPKKNREDLGIKEDEFVFGLVARGIPEKGYEQAIEGLNYINKKLDKKAHLLLIGSGKYIDELKAKHSSNYIHFLDNMSEPLEWIGYEEIFDCGLLPSYFKSESLPTVIVEMLFLNKPIIATDIAEIKSMIDDNKIACGATIPLKNGKPDQKILNDEMLKIVKDKKYYTNLVKNTEKFSKRFDMGNCIEEYSNLIEDNNE